MLEQLLGTALLCCIITTFFYCLFYKIACRFNINDSEADCPYIGDYASSIIIFLEISSLTLLIVVCYYITISSKLPKFLNESGFAFAFLQLLAGLFIRLLHKLFFFTISKITKITSYHKLTSSEISWTWLILCFIYGIVFLINKEYTIAFTYFVREGKRKASTIFPHTSFEVIVRKCFNGVCHVENQCGNSSTNHVLSVFCIASMTIDIDSLYYFVPVTQDIYLNHNLN